MGLFDIFKKKTKTQNATSDSCSKTRSSFSSERKYIYLYGSDMGASHIVGNIEVINDIPYFITNTDGAKEETDWVNVVEQFKKTGLPAYLWVKNINVTNWSHYAFTLRPHEQPKDIGSIRIFGFPNESPYTNPVFYEVVICKQDKKPYIRYSVSNGHSGHDPWLVSISQPVTFEDIRFVAEELNLSKYIDINETNWMDKIETFGGANVYQVPDTNTIFDIFSLLKEKQLQPTKIDCIPFFENEYLKKKTTSIEDFNNAFADDWRMYSFKVKCQLNNKFVVHIDGLTKEVVATWPINIKELLS